MSAAGQGRCEGRCVRDGDGWAGRAARSWGGGWRHAPRGRGGAGPPGGLEQSGRGEANLSRRRRRRWFCLFLLPPAPGNRQPRPRCACGVPPPVRGSLSLPAAALGRVEGLPFPSGVRPRSFPPPPPSLPQNGGPLANGSAPALSGRCHATRRPPRPRLPVTI